MLPGRPSASCTTSTAAFANALVPAAIATTAITTAANCAAAVSTSAAAAVALCPASPLAALALADLAATCTTRAALTSRRLQPPLRPRHLPRAAHHA